MLYKAENGALSVTIDDLGAEPVSLLFRGRERLWQNENGSWAGHAPVLFPVCGNCGYSFGGMPRHGFARKRRFFAGEGDFPEFHLCADEGTRALYPFDFCLSVRHSLEGNCLLTRYAIENRGPEPMPFSYGWHVSHALFSPLEEHSLVFGQEESLVALGHDGDGFLTGEQTDLGEGVTLPLSEELFSGRTIILAPKSRSVRLERAGKPLAEVCFETPYLLLWRPPSALALCIEPWANLPDRRGAAQPFCFLRPGERRCATQKITYFEV